MKLNKLFAGVLAAAMMMSIGVSAMAEDVQTTPNVNASFNKIYKLTNSDTTSPEETFTFKFSNGTATKTNKSNVTAPTIPDSTVTFSAGDANTVAEQATKAVSVALNDIEWPDIGVYIYDVKEVKGDTQGVTYSTVTNKLKVTVAYDRAVQKYYTAFVSLSLADENGDGQTDNKSNGFTNEYSAGSLEVKKVVTGNAQDPEKKFTITVTFAVDALTSGDTSTNPVKSTINYGTNGSIAPSEWTLKDGKYTASATINLGSDATETFTNIPYGVTYTVEEDSKHLEGGDGYSVSYSFNTDATNGGTTQKIDTAVEKTTVTNTKNSVIDTGVILDNAPYILMLAVVAGGAFFMVAKKRREE